MAAALVQFRQGATTGTAGQAMLGSRGTSVQVQNGASNTGIVIWTFTVVSVPSASAEFKAFVANASIGGVFQGKPAKALINGRITREGQLIDSELGVVFDHIDADSKVIYFKDVGGAVVSKSY